MKTETKDLAIGQKFKNSVLFADGTTHWFDVVYTIYNITDKRVCYTDGCSDYCGATNRKVSGAWLGLKGFKKDVASGKIALV